MRSETRSFEQKTCASEVRFFTEKTAIVPQLRTKNMCKRSAFFYRKNCNCPAASNKKHVQAKRVFLQKKLQLSRSFEHEILYSEVNKSFEKAVISESKHRVPV